MKIASAKGDPTKLSPTTESSPTANPVSTQ
jgi:hypothetical protein